MTGSSERVAMADFVPIALHPAFVAAFNPDR